MKMNITIIGSGHAGSTVAADLSLKGHRVTLMKTSNKIHNEHFAKILSSKKIYIHENETIKLSEVFATTDLSIAISQAELVIIFLQTNYHESILKKISPFFRDGQYIMFQPGYMSTAYLLKYCEKAVTVIEAESSPIDCRIIEPGHVKVLFRNVLNPVGVYPRHKTNSAKIVLNNLEFPFEIISSVVEAAIHNPNLIVHTIGAIFSIPRIEYSKGKYSMYREVFTPHIWNVVENLDLEKMNILEKLGYKRIPYVEAFKRRNSINNQMDAKEIFFDYANNFSPTGPEIPDSRYITEDVPEGLVLLESLGKFLDINTPTCSGLINCASAALRRDFRIEGRTFERLGISFVKKILADKCSKTESCIEQLREEECTKFH